MPIYEYHCQPCNYTFEMLIRSSEDIARCPRCSNVDVAKQLSVPALLRPMRGSASSTSSTDGLRSLGCGRPECSSGNCAFE
jgi:putative FmdB family regulatory protein